MKKTKIDLIKLDSAKDQNRPPSVKEEEKTLSEEALRSGPKIKLTKKLILICGMGGLLLLGGAIGTAGYLGYLSIPGLSRSASKDNKPAPSVPERSEVGHILKLSPLVINLKGESGRNYLKTTIVLEVDKKDGVEKIQSRMSLLTDVVILTLSDKQFEDLRKPESKEELKQELLSKMNQHLNPHQIKRIYFDEFLYQ